MTEMYIIQSILLTWDSILAWGIDWINVVGAWQRNVYVLTIILGVVKLKPPLGEASVPISLRQIQCSADLLAKHFTGSNEEALKQTEPEDAT